MTVAGKLVISINGNNHIYTRITSGGVQAISIKEGPIRVYGGGVAATVYAAPLAFAPAGIFFHNYASGYPYANCTMSGTSISP
jgi:hypothetical protein